VESGKDQTIFQNFCPTLFTIKGILILMGHVHNVMSLFLVSSFGAGLAVKGLAPDLFAGRLPPTCSPRFVSLLTQVLLGKLWLCL
jgi:hypothetical protein